MAVKSLAIKYRPKTFDDVTEQGAIRQILCQQLETNTVKNAYLFCGGAGTGKTTCARIFANELNRGQGNAIEMDAASNSGVDDVRDIIQQAKTKSLDSEYKVFIIDECHSISNTGWQAFLKLIEEPPAKSIFIFCTTDPQKIPKTILSRVQRYDFQRISHEGIVKRLKYILDYEGLEHFYKLGAIDYIAKIADGGMRDAITLLDKCMAYSNDLTIENVVEALGVTDYSTMFELTDAIIELDSVKAISIIEKVHLAGKDLKQFVKTYMAFLLDISKFEILGTFDYITIPKTPDYENWLDDCGEYEYTMVYNLLPKIIRLNSDIKWDTSPKTLIEATLIIFIQEEKEQK